MTSLRIVLLAVPLALLGGCMLMGGRPNPNANTSTTRFSESGRYEVSYRPDVTPVPRRALHSWTVELRDRAGRPVDGATIRVDGGMPDHGHGLPTQPAVREALGGGAYVVDGMKFNMGGYWVVDLAIDAPGGDDTVRFELNL
ncbi:FixH family protein [Vulgatibacter sp.]|uniref:FixH family protein n=1 Tax=Vulgatibacter sp. TaxID=1971226 RepID=UPI003568D230